jgi:hypothetical protein
MATCKPLLGIVLGLSLVTAPVAVHARMPGDAAFINGGIGEDEIDAMRLRAREYPLRIVFAQGNQNAFTANVPVEVTDARGKRVLALPDAGPLLYVMVPDGRYTVTAEVDGIVKSQQVAVSRGQGREVVFHWRDSEPYSQ